MSFIAASLSLAARYLYMGWLQIGDTRHGTRSLHKLSARRLLQKLTNVADYVHRYRRLKHTVLTSFSVGVDLGFYSQLRIVDVPLRKRIIDPILGSVR